MPLATITMNPILDGSKAAKRGKTIAQGREKRRSVAENFRKSARSRVLQSKRMMPSDVKENQFNGRKTSTKSDERRERLKRWKEQREVAKSALQVKVRRTFVVKHVVHSPPRFLGPSTKTSTKVYEEPLRNIFLKSKKGNSKEEKESSVMPGNTVSKRRGKENEDACFQIAEPKNDAETSQEVSALQQFIASYDMTKALDFNFLFTSKNQDPIAVFNNSVSSEKRTSVVSLDKSCTSSSSGLVTTRMSNVCVTKYDDHPCKTENGDIEPNSHENAGKRFRGLLEEETEKLINQCNHWDSFLQTEQVSENVQGDIRSTIGQAKLVMDQRFEQFSGLIDLHESKTGEKETRASDLEGFWEMIYFQVDDVHKKFSDLESRRQQNWEEPEVVKKRRTCKANKKAPCSTSANGSKRKTDFKKFRAEMKAKMNSKDTEPHQGSMGFINVLTPMKRRSSVVSDSIVEESVVLTSVRRSTRKRKSIVPELDFSKEPTYVLPLSIFEDCLRSSSSEWPIVGTIEEGEEHLSSPESFRPTTRKTSNDFSPGCAERLSSLTLSSPLVHTTQQKPEPFDGSKDSPVLLHYLKPSVETPGTDQTDQCNGLSTVTPRRSLRRRTGHAPSDLIFFSP